MKLFFLCDYYLRIQYLVASAKSSPDSTTGSSWSFDGKNASSFISVIAPAKLCSDLVSPFSPGQRSSEPIENCVEFEFVRLCVFLLWRSAGFCPRPIGSDVVLGVRRSLLTLFLKGWFLTFSAIFGDISSSKASFNRTFGAGLLLRVWAKIAIYMFH